MKKKKKLIQEKQRLRPSKSEVYRLICDNKKLIKLTNWKAKNSGQVNLIKGLTKTIEWYKKEENLIKFKSNIYNR